MNACIPLLQELQQIESRPDDVTAERQQRAVELRAQIPAPVLAHYNRLVVNRVKPIAEVRRGICGGCHLKLASWVRQAAADDDLHVCENCGAYLVFPVEEPERVATTPRISRRRAARLDLIRAAATAAAVH
jgi:predicted  nucleic acid-binding Zn-ribbon protein